ncbi:Hok/Gef family protein, partial [Escherichia coli]|nr:Hok/Gef family protein [Escherichia coli]
MSVDNGGKKRRKKRGLFAPCILFCPPAVGAALVTRKALCEVHTGTGQRGVAFSPATESEKEQGGGVIPATLQ